MVLGDRTNKKQENGGQLTNIRTGVKVDNLLTLEHTYIHIYPYNLYTYIYVVGSISGPHFNLCWVNKWSTCSRFVCFLLLSAGRMRLFKRESLKQPNIETQV